MKSNGRSSSPKEVSEHAPLTFLLRTSVVSCSVGRRAARFSISELCPERRGLLANPISNSFPELICDLFFRWSDSACSSCQRIPTAPLTLDVLDAVPCPLRPESGRGTGSLLDPNPHNPQTPQSTKSSSFCSGPTKRGNCPRSPTYISFCPPS